MTKKLEEHDVTDVRIKPVLVTYDEKMFHCTDVFITYLRDNKLLVAYSRLAYPIDPKSHMQEKQAFLRRMNRNDNG